MTLKLSVEYGDKPIHFSVRRKDRKTLEIAVEPDTTVTVVAPLDASDEDISKRVKKEPLGSENSNVILLSFYRALQRVGLFLEKHTFILVGNTV